MRRYHVVAAQLKHKSNTFNIVRTDLNSYRERQFQIGDAVVENLADTETEIGGFIAVARKFDWDLTPALAADATPGGRLTSECWRTLTDLLFSTIRSAEKVDGLLLALHGAMATEEFDDGDGELLSQLRELVGPDVPIVATIDMHANVTERMVANASALVAFRTYPHIDHVERALQAGDLLQRLMQGDGRPRSAVVRGPLLSGVDHGRTSRSPSASGPMDRILELAAKYEAEPDILVVNVCAGFAWQDQYETGPSITVTCDADEDRALSVASEIMSGCPGDTVGWIRSPGSRPTKRSPKYAGATSIRSSSPISPTILAAEATGMPPACWRRCSMPASTAPAFTPSTTRRRWQPASRRASEGS